MKRKKGNTSAVHIKKSKASRIFDFCNAAFMILFCITIVFPMWDVIVRSFSIPTDISLSKLNLFPRHITLSAYEYCLGNRNIFHSVLVSFSRTIIGTLIHLCVVSLAAYALTREELPFRKIIQIYFIIPMFIGAGTIPNYLNMKDLGLINNFWVYVLPSAFSLYNCIIMRNFFYSIDKGLEESASIDGASQFRIFLNIILPLSKPVIATVALWQMVGQWNSWFDNMMYNLQSENLLTLQYLLRKMLNTVAYGFNSVVASTTAAAVPDFSMEMTAENVKAAITVLVVVPIVCVYPFIQKYFVKGIMVGAVKG